MPRPEELVHRQQGLGHPPWRRGCSGSDRRKLRSGRGGCSNHAVGATGTRRAASELLPGGICNTCCTVDGGKRACAYMSVSDGAQTSGAGRCGGAGTTDGGRTLRRGGPVGAERQRPGPREATCSAEPPLCRHLRRASTLSAPQSAASQRLQPAGHRRRPAQRRIHIRVTAGGPASAAFTFARRCTVPCRHLRLRIARVRCGQQRRGRWECVRVVPKTPACVAQSTAPAAAAASPADASAAPPPAGAPQSVTP